MSRIGRKPIAIPDGVTVKIEPDLVRVRGPKGELSEAVSSEMKVVQDNGTLTVERPSDRGEHRGLLVAGGDDPEALVGRGLEERVDVLAG